MKWEYSSTDGRKNKEKLPTLSVGRGKGRISLSPTTWSVKADLTFDWGRGAKACAI